MSIKAAIVDGPITPELFQRLESMGFEIVDMNDREAMQGLRRRLEIEEVMRKAHDATGIPVIVFRQELSKLELHPEPMPIPERLLFPFTIEPVEPMPDIRIDKTQDRFSPFDKFAGRGKGPARSQKFSNHFKRK